MSAVKDEATVTSSGERLEKFIDGVTIRPAVTQIDERGELCEIYSTAWGVMPDPVPYVYSAMLRPGRIKGWVFHKVQKDRLFALSGFMKVVLYDMREDSPTHGMVNELHFTERNRSLLVIPPNVAHAVQNIGTMDAYFINMPNIPYNHSDPDKYRVDKAVIPYDFNKGAGW